MSWKRPPPPPAAAGYGFAEPPAKAARSLYGYASADANGDDAGVSSAFASARLYCGFSGAIGEMAPPGTVGEHGVVQGVRAGIPHGSGNVASVGRAGAGICSPPPPPCVRRGCGTAATADLLAASGPGPLLGPAPGPLLGPVGAWTAHLPDAEELDEPVGDGVFAAEVERIVSIDKGDYRRIFGLSIQEALDAKVIQTRYKHIMRIIHPDKRRALEVARAGGKPICDEAVILVQQALAAARIPAVAGSKPGSKPAPEDPEAVLRREAQQRIRKQQEVVRSQAQAAKMRGMAMEQAEQQRCTAQVSHLMQSIQKTLLIESLQEALVNKGEAAEIVSAPADRTTAQIMALLAQKNGGARCEPAVDVVDLT